MDAKLLLLGFVSFLLLCNPLKAAPFSTRRVLRGDHNNGTAPAGRVLGLKHENLRHVGEVVVVANGRVELTFSVPGGDVIGIKYGGIDNLLETRNPAGNRGYWDMVWGEEERNGTVISHYDRLGGAKFKIVRHDEKQLELSFTRTWNQTGDAYPVNVDKRYIILRDYPGFYTYTILEHPVETPATLVSVIRAVFKLRQENFQYMAISDDRRRIMPTAQDRSSGQKLAYPEAVLLTNPSDNELRGEVDDKYQYSMDHRNIKVHGWISSRPDVGFWVITPSHEFLTTGPMKQELTSHVGPTSLSVFMSCHYVGRDLVMSFEQGESWKKVYGPIAVYLNKVKSSTENHHDVLWEEAKAQAKKESRMWPYSFVNSEDFPSRSQRGTVTGQLLVNDRYVKNTSFAVDRAYVGLAKPGDAGTWQTENKGYQFWEKTDATGNFSVKNVRPGNYNLYAFLPGVIGDYMYSQTITVKPGQSVDLNSIVYNPPRNGPTLWEIGIPDRTAGEFFIPNPLPTLENRLIANKTGNRFRQYGLWDRYTDLYPDHDLVYTIGESDYQRDWFYAHVNRRGENGTYQSTTWQVRFNVERVNRRGSYTLRVAVATATGTDLQVRFNNPNTYRPLFQTRLIGRDNAIARHGIHGLYWLFNVDVPGHALQDGQNVLYLTQARSNGPFGGLMYDYIRFEAPAHSSRAL